MALSKNKKRFVIVIIIFALLIAFGPYILGRIMREKAAKQPQTRDFMIKVSGVIQSEKQGSQEAPIEQPYLKGSNGLYYVLIGDKMPEILGYIDKEATVFGNIYQPAPSDTIAGNPVRFKIGVVKFDLAPAKTEEDAKAKS